MDVTHALIAGQWTAGSATRFDRDYSDHAEARAPTHVVQVFLAGPGEQSGS